MSNLDLLQRIDEKKGWMGGGTVTTSVTGCCDEILGYFKAWFLIE